MRLKKCVFFLIILMVVLVPISCSDSKLTPTPTPLSPTPTIQVITVHLPDNQTGLFLVTDDNPTPLKAQHLSRDESVNGYGLPQTSDPFPVVASNKDSINLYNLYLRRMVGG